MKTLEQLRNNYAFDQILITALWAECDPDSNNHLESNFTTDDFTDYAVEYLSEKYNHFIDVAKTILPPDFIVDWSQFAHDFWLTCNGHGAGFWDRDELQYQNLGNQLTNLCETIYLGSLYITDDNTICIH